MSAKENSTEYPRFFRAWHWLNAIVIIGLLITVLLRKTFLSYRDNAAIIQNKLAASSVTVNPELAQGVAKAIRDKMWEWHVIFGIALAILLVGRLALFLAGQNAKAALGRFSQGHLRVMKSLYAFFYAVTSLMVITGLIQVFKKDLGISKEFSKLIKESHEFAMWGVLGFVLLHIVGVILAEFKESSKGIISRMISGNHH